MKTIILLIGAAINGIIALVCSLAALLSLVGIFADTSLAENRRNVPQYALVAAYALLNLTIVKMAFGSRVEGVARQAPAPAPYKEDRGRIKES